MSAGFEFDPEFHTTPVSKSRARRGFRVAHLAVASGVIALVIMIVLPAGRSARPAARRAMCSNNLKQIALALLNYEQEYNALPPAYSVDAQGRPLHSWRTLILPYLDQGPLYQTIDLAKPWNDPANAKALQTPISAFRCPEASGANYTTTYLAIAGSNGCLTPERPRRLAEITDPTPWTLMIIEAGTENAVPWMAPVDADESLVMNLGPTTSFHHTGGTNACFVDGGVRFLPAKIPANVRRAIMTISGNDNTLFTEW